MRRQGFGPWVRKVPCRSKWQPTPVFMPGKSHALRSLVGYSPRGHKETWLSDFTSLPLQNNWNENIEPWPVNPDYLASVYSATSLNSTPYPLLFFVILVWCVLPTTSKLSSCCYSLSMLSLSLFITCCYLIFRFQIKYLLPREASPGYPGHLPALSHPPTL